MKQKYTILKETGKNELIIREYAELDKETLSLLCEEKHNLDEIKEAAGNMSALISKLRTLNMYPPAMYATKLAEAVISLCQSETDEPVDMIFNDSDFLTKESEDKKAEEEAEEEEDEEEEIEGLLENDPEESLDNASTISNVSAESPIKIADESSLEIDDDA
ncbi:hypothetical protein QUF76_07115 [Desulfobacterales bacterium HSG16]|nr:hypothetical protein [Desulfobacterales bacterium HSG16]